MEMSCFFLASGMFFFTSFNDGCLPTVFFCSHDEVDVMWFGRARGGCARVSRKRFTGPPQRFKWIRCAIAQFALLFE